MKNNILIDDKVASWLEKKNRKNALYMLAIGVHWENLFCQTHQF